MTVLIIIVAVLVIAYLLYLGNRVRERRRLEAAQERERLGTEAAGHRSMADQHESKAGELQEAADREQRRAERHQRRAAEVDPDVQTEADAK
jgi:hypothetical protein